VLPVIGSMPVELRSLRARHRIRGTRPTIDEEMQFPTSEERAGERYGSFGVDRTNSPQQRISVTAMDLRRGGRVVTAMT